MTQIDEPEGCPGEAVNLANNEQLIDLARVVAEGNSWPVSSLKLVHFVRQHGLDIEDELLA